MLKMALYNDICFYMESLCGFFVCLFLVVFGCFLVVLCWFCFFCFCFFLFFWDVASMYYVS